jgi:hypothetical protein
MLVKLILVLSIASLAAGCVLTLLGIGVLSAEFRQREARRKVER